MTNLSGRWQARKGIKQGSSSLDYTLYIWSANEVAAHRFTPYLYILSVAKQQRLLSSFDERLKSMLILQSSRKVCKDISILSPVSTDASIRQIRSGFIASPRVFSSRRIAPHTSMATTIEDVWKIELSEENDEKATPCYVHDINFSPLPVQQ